ncbi:MAG: glycosyltransferase [Deltaproteobacteria bacterium]|nr:glycosyltransferase [Deltaproteobacteria bacterium]
MRLLVARGGTGGHLRPGIAIAWEVVRRGGGEALFVGTSRAIETRVVPAAPRRPLPEASVRRPLSPGR